MVFCPHLQSKHTDPGTSPARLDAAPSRPQPEGFVRRPQRGEHPGEPSESPSWARCPQHRPPHKTSGHFQPSRCVRGFLGTGVRGEFGLRSRAVTGADAPKHRASPSRAVAAAGTGHGRGAEAPSAAGATRGDPRPGLGPPRLALRCATQQARVGNDIIAPNVCSVCWDFTGDDK